MLVLAMYPRGLFRILTIIVLIVVLVTVGNGVAPDRIVCGGAGDLVPVPLALPVSVCQRH